MNMIKTIERETTTATIVWALPNFGRFSTVIRLNMPVDGIDREINRRKCCKFNEIQHSLIEGVGL